MTAARFDLCVVLYRAPVETRAFLTSLLDLAPTPRFRLHVLDNSPDDQAWHVLADFSEPLREAGVPVLADRDPSNPGFPRGINRLATWGDAEFVGVLNADTKFVAHDTLARIAAMFDEESDVAIQGPRQTTSDGRLMHTGWVWDRDGSGQVQRHQFDGVLYDDGESYRDVKDLEMITGSALFARRSVWDDLAACPTFRDSCPDAEGPLLPTQHYHDDSWLTAHAHHHGHRLVYRGDIPFVHEYHRSHEEDGPYDREAWATAWPMFQRVMDEHGISTRRGSNALS